MQSVKNLFSWNIIHSDKNKFSIKTDTEHHTCKQMHTIPQRPTHIKYIDLQYIAFCRTFAHTTDN